MRQKTQQRGKGIRGWEKDNVERVQKARTGGEAKREKKRGRDKEMNRKSPCRDRK